MPIPAEHLSDSVMSINDNNFGYQMLREGLFYGTSCDHLIPVCVGAESVDRARRGITLIRTAVEAGPVPSAVPA